MSVREATLYYLAEKKITVQDVADHYAFPRHTTAVHHIGGTGDLYAISNERIALPLHRAVRVNGPWPKGATESIERPNNEAWFCLDEAAQWMVNLHEWPKVRELERHIELLKRGNRATLAACNVHRGNEQRLEGQLWAEQNRANSLRALFTSEPWYKRAWLAVFKPREVFE